MAENYIINKIITDAETSAKEEIAAAKKQASTKLQEIKAELEQNETAELAKLSQIIRAEESHAQAIKQLHARNEMLAARQHTINRCFELARLKLKSKAKTITTALAKKYANKNDKICYIDGGVIISGKDFDLRLTIDDILDNVRTNHETEIAEILFGG